MAQNDKPVKLWQSKHFWYTVTPLLVTLLLFALLNKFSPQPEAPQTSFLPATAVPAKSATPPATLTRPPILQATILPSPTATTTPRPTLPSTATVELLGPPTESGVLLNSRLAFYWSYSEPLLPGQQFVLTLWQNEAIVIEETVARTNLGEGFQLSLDLDGVQVLPGTAVWQLQLTEADSQQSLLVSEERTLVFYSE